LSAKQAQKVKELEEDMRLIKVIMKGDLVKSENIDDVYVYSFNDIELTKINWIK